MNKAWADSGIPGGAHSKRLLYNVAAEALVAEITERLEQASQFRVTRLFTRLVSEERYRPIPADNPLVIQTDAASCAASGFVVYNEVRLRPFDGDEARAADWFALRRFDLRSGSIDRSLEGQDLRVPAPYRHGWISCILAARPDGEGAVCSVALEPPADSEGKVVVDFSIYDVSFNNGLGRKIGALPHIHF